MPAASDMIELLLDKTLEVCRDKEISKKLRPFSLAYTIEILQITFEQKDMRVDKRLDDAYI